MSMKRCHGLLGPEKFSKLTGKGFEKYRWKGIYGKEASWIGKPLYGINRMILRASWASEYINGKLETRWEAPIPMDLFVEKK